MIRPDPNNGKPRTAHPRTQCDNPVRSRRRASSFHIPPPPHPARPCLPIPNSQDLIHLPARLASPNNHAVAGCASGPLSRPRDPDRPLFQPRKHPHYHPANRPFTPLQRQPNNNYQHHRQLPRRHFRRTPVHERSSPRPAPRPASLRQNSSPPSLSITSALSAPTTTTSCS